MGDIAATEFKARCLELMDRVAEYRETYIITKRGKPVAKLAPVEPKPKDSLFGCLRDKVKITGDIIKPALPAEAWKTLKEWDELAGRIPVRKSPRSRR